MKKFFGILFKSITVLLGVLIATITALVFLGISVNLDFMRGGVEAAASNALHRDVAIEGPVELEFSNWPALNISDVKIANVKGGIKPNLLNAGFVRMQIGVFPLLRGEINIADITAEEVKLNLESDANGNPNWVFGEPSKTKTAELDPEKKVKTQAINSSTKGQSKRIQFTALSHLSLQQINVSYEDLALGKTLSFVLESMEGTAAEGEPIELKLNGKVQDKAYNLSVAGGSLEDLFNKSESWGFETRGELFGKQVSGEGNMLLRGEHPEVHLALAASDIDVGSILAALGLIEGMQASLGDVGMDITLTGDSLNEILSKSSMEFSIKQGSWTVAVPNTEASFDINSLDGSISVKEGNNITIALDGAIEDVPVELLITGAPLVKYVSDQEALPLSIKANILETRLNFDSNIKLPIASTDMTFALKVSSQRLDRLNDLLDLNLPAIGPILLESKLDIKPQLYHLSALNLKVGESKLDGSLKIDLSQDKPKLNASLVSAFLQLDDYRTESMRQTEEAQSESSEEESKSTADSEEVVEEANPKKGKSVFSYEVLNTFDADIRIAAEQVQSGEEKLGSAEVVVEIENASLKVEPITLEIPGGHFNAGVEYTPSASDIGLKIRADIEDFDVGVLIRHLKPESDMGGRLYLDIDLDSTAPDPASIMANASGKLDFGLVPKNFSAGIIDLWAVNLLSAIMDKSTEKDQSVMNCVVIRTKLDEGVLEEEAIYLDTSNMRIAGKMDINFKTRDLDIKLAPKAKSPEFFSVAVPIQVKGSLDDFGLKIGVLRMVGQVVSFITSPVHVPVRRVFTEDSPEDGVEACIYAWTVTDAETSRATE